jgi:uncharacterized protein
MGRSIVIVGKAPRPGLAKTRLVPPLTYEGAAALYRAFLLDVVDMALGLGWEDTSVVHPADAVAGTDLGDLLPPGVRLRPQAGDGLGAALAGAFRSQLGAGLAPVVLIGSDSPTLTAPLVEAAAHGLATHDLVVGPSADGGYYLIGMSRPHLAVFDAIAWSTSMVFEQTMTRARALGLRTLVLPEWYDVDTVEDLSRLREHLAVLPPRVAAATRAALASSDWSAAG